MDAREKRLAQNEALYREINERIEALAKPTATCRRRRSADFAYFCECANADSTSRSPFRARSTSGCAPSRTVSSSHRVTRRPRWRSSSATRDVSPHPSRSRATRHASRHLDPRGRGLADHALSRRRSRERDRERTTIFKHFSPTAPWLATRDLHRIAFARKKSASNRALRRARLPWTATVRLCSVCPHDRSDRHTAAPGESRRAPRRRMRVSTSHTGARTYVVGSRQVRPNLPSTLCPFCPGGLEAPEDYDVRWFRTAGRRWPTSAARSCSTRRSTTRRSGRSASTGARRVVDLWAERTAALGARADVDYVLVFENRGAEVGATIAHPARPDLRLRPRPRAAARRARARRALLRAGRPPRRDRARLARLGPRRTGFPYELLLVPDAPVPDLPSLDGDGRDGLAALLVDVLERLDRALRRADAVHALDPPAPLRRRRVAAGAPPRRDRLAVARARASRASSRPASSAPASSSTRSRRRRRRRRCVRERPAAACA